MVVKSQVSSSVGGWVSFPTWAGSGLDGGEARDAMAAGAPPI